MRRVAFFVNPVLAARRSRQAEIARCADLLRARGAAVDLFQTELRWPISSQVQEVVANGVDTVFACGGDGTVFQVLQGMTNTKAALGIIPMGTGNILARNLRLPRNPVSALTMQMNSEPVAIPLGEIVCADTNGVERNWYFTIAAGVGFHSLLMDHSRKGSGKKRFGRGAYYARGMFLLTTRAPQFLHAVLNQEGSESIHVRACELIAVRVPEIGPWRSGGDLRSPQLQVAFVYETSRGGLAHACIRALFPLGKELSTRTFGLPHPQHRQATDVVIEPIEPETPVQADGEVIGKGSATIRMSRNSVRLLWPALPQD